MEKKRYIQPIIEVQSVVGMNLMDVVIPSKDPAPGGSGMPPKTRPF